MAPIRLTREKEEMLARKAKLETELAALPGQIQATQDEISRLGEEYVPFKAMEKT